MVQKSKATVNVKDDNVTPASSWYTVRFMGGKLVCKPSYTYVRKDDIKRTVPPRITLYLGADKICLDGYMVKFIGDLYGHDTKFKEFVDNSISDTSSC